MVECRPVQTSAVYVLGQAQFEARPPPSPPSPVTPNDVSLCEPDELDLNSTADSLCSSSLPPHDETEERLRSAVHVLQTEATALHFLARLYESDPTARSGFDRSIAAITRHRGERGKLVIVGVGKSGHIAKKLVATFNSLAVHATFLHPTEALHGDLGKVGRDDTILFITFSGRTSELLALVPHIAPSLPVVVLTSHTTPEACELTRLRADIILLPAPIHEPETASFGVSAPTTSTTAALALGDALAVAASRELHHHDAGGVSAVFARNHPGGAIGAAFRAPRRVRDLCAAWDGIAMLVETDAGKTTTTAAAALAGADVLKAAYDSATGWVRVGGRGGGAVASPSRIRRLSSADLAAPLDRLGGRLLTEQEAMVSVAGGMDIKRAKEWAANLLAGGGREGGEEEEDAGGSGGAGFGPDTVLRVVENGEIVGVLEVARLLDCQV